MKEKDLENYIVANPNVIEDGLILVGQQQYVAGKIVDILFESKLGEVVVVEVKQIANRKDIAQLADYAAYFLERSKKPVRVIIVAFRIPKNFKNTFDFFGIEYVEVPGDQIAKETKESNVKVTVNQSMPKAGTHNGGYGEINLTRKSMAQRLKSGHLFQQASHIINLLNSSEHGLTMREIVNHRKEKGYTSKSYYDL